MSSDLKRRTAARPYATLALIALTLGLSGGAPVPASATPGAGPATAPAPGSSSPGEKIADALRTSPVYVDPSYEASAVPPARQKELVAQIRKTGLPIKVILVPLATGDSFGGDPDTLATVVRDRLADEAQAGRDADPTGPDPDADPGADPDRDLILLTSEKDRNDDIHGFEWPEDTHQADDAAAAVGIMDEFDDAGLAERTAGAIDLIARGEGTKAYAKASKELDESLADHVGAGPDDSAGSGASDRPGWPVLVAAIAAGLTCAALLVRSVSRRRGQGWGRGRRSPRGAHATAPFAFPQAVFAAARTADESELRRRAEAEVLALGEAA
ncbi:hypothetical protein ABZ369_30395, partial [Streptomyces sp. NPDC005918]